MILYNFDLNILIINKNYIVNYNKIKNNIYLNIINDTDIEKINFNDFESFKEYCKKNTDIDYNKIINIINDNKFDIIEYLNDNIELINNTNNSNIINILYDYVNSFKGGSSSDSSISEELKDSLQKAIEQMMKDISDTFNSLIKIKFDDSKLKILSQVNTSIGSLILDSNVLYSHQEFPLLLVLNTLLTFRFMA